jgi:hypothetical protein
MKNRMASEAIRQSMTKVRIVRISLLERQGCGLWDDKILASVGLEDLVWGKRSISAREPLEDACGLDGRDIAQRRRQVEGQSLVGPQCENDFASARYERSYVGNINNSGQQSLNWQSHSTLRHSLTLGQKRRLERMASYARRERL